jgi:DNA-binding NarL/FixJ family response regulator
MREKIHILLADDHAVVRQGFKMILAAQPDMEIVGEAGNGREALDLAGQLQPDVIVMDVAMPELNGIEATRRIADLSPRDLLAAVRAVARGEGYLSPGVSDAVLNDYRRHVTDPIDLLTSREREVLQMIAEGKTNKDIATVLNLSVYTVDAHRGHIMEKLNLHSVTDLVRFAVRAGLVD